jgi:hypothetical protein
MRFRTPCLLAFSLCCSCAAPRVRVPLMHPAEINLAKYRSLGIAEMSGGAVARATGGLLEEQLLRSDRFTVVDRQRIQSVMSELQLASTDLADAKNSVKLGSLVTAGALISGSVEESYTETPHEDRFTTQKGEVHFHRYTTAQLTVSATFRLTDVSTGTLLIAKRFTAQRAHGPTSSGEQIASSLFGALVSQVVESGDTTDATPDRNKMENDACAEVVGRFAAAIQPTSEMVEVEFATDDAVPQLQTGIDWARHGDWLKAQGSFNAAIQDSERSPKIGASTLSKVYLDAALSYEYSGEHDKALGLLDHAYQLSGGSRRILEEMDNVKRLQADAKRLAEQRATTEKN